MRRLPAWLPRAARDALMRRRYHHQLEEALDSDFTVSVARTTEAYEDAFRLVRISYAYQGYLPVAGPEIRFFSQHVLAESVVLVARHRDRIVGTMTVTLDSPAGLPLDKDYPSQLEQLRGRGECLVEYGALAVLQPYLGSGVTMLLNLAATWLSANLLDADRVVIGINPRAEDWYRATLAFSSFASAATHADLAAPVIGLTHELDRFRRFLRRRFSRLANGQGVDACFFDQPPEAIELPNARNLAELDRWKLPRHVFRALFVDRVDRLAELDPCTRAHLSACRSPRTLEAPTHDLLR